EGVVGYPLRPAHNMNGRRWRQDSRRRQRIGEHGEEGQHKAARQRRHRAPARHAPQSRPGLNSSQGLMGRMVGQGWLPTRAAPRALPAIEEAWGYGLERIEVVVVERMIRAAPEEVH